MPRQYHEIHGLNGFFGRLWKRIKNRVKETLVGGLVFDLIESIWPKVDLGGDRSPLTPQQAAQLDSWIDSTLEPITFRLVVELIAETKPSTLSTKSHLAKINVELEKLTALKAYYEFRMTVASNPMDKKLQAEKINAINEALGVSTKTLEGALPAGSAILKTDNVFNALSYTKIGGTQLNWSGAKVINAIAPEYGPAPVVGNPTGGNTSKPGGGSTSPGGSTSKPGGSTSKPGGGATNTGGSTTYIPGGSSGKPTSKPGGSTGNNVPGTSTPIIIPGGGYQSPPFNPDPQPSQNGEEPRQNSEQSQSEPKRSNNIIWIALAAIGLVAISKKK